MEHVNAIFDLVYRNYALVFSSLSALVALISALSARRETRLQTDLQNLRLRQSIDAAALGWGNEAITIMAKASTFSRHIPERTERIQFNADQDDILYQLSAIIDRGRMFFPNVDLDAKGHHKAAAFRGHRPPLLDALVWAYKEIEALTLTDKLAGLNSCHFIEDCRRLLVSELQIYLDPKRMDSFVGRYDSQSRKDQDDAVSRAAALRHELVRRRPTLDIDGRHDTAAKTETDS